MTRKIALVTGAGSGIGRAVAVALGNAGYTVVLAGRHASSLYATVELAGESGGRCLAIPCDVTSENAVDVLFGRLSAELGRLDVLFNNAGLSIPTTRFEDIGLAQWQSIIDTNLTGAFLVARRAYQVMKNQNPQGGRIINNGSIAAHAPRPRMAAYASSKHALTGLTKSIALEGREHGIACGQIDIGNAATDLSTTIAQGALQSDLSIKSEPTFDAKHIADAVLYMARLPTNVNVLSMTLLPTRMPFVGRG